MRRHGRNKNNFFYNLAESIINIGIVLLILGLMAGVIIQIVNLLS